MKDLSDRLQECVRLRGQLCDLGLAPPYQLVDAMNVFVREGVPSSGKVFLPQAGRTLEYVLSTKHPCSAVLRSTRS
jgi:hypothetical protein